MVLCLKRNKTTSTFVHWAYKYQSPPDHICISTFFPEFPWLCSCFILLVKKEDYSHGPVLLYSNYCDSSLHDHLTKNWHWVSKVHLSFFLTFLISYKFLILKKQKEKKEHWFQDCYVPWPTNSKGTGKGSGFHTGEESLSRLQGRLESQQTPPADPYGRRTKEKTNSQKGRAASSWTWPREGGNVLKSFCQLTSPGGRRGGRKESGGRMGRRRSGEGVGKGRRSGGGWGGGEVGRE